MRHTRHRLDALLRLFERSYADFMLAHEIGEIALGVTRRTREIARAREYLVELMAHSDSRIRELGYNFARELCERNCASDKLIDVAAAYEADPENVETVLPVATYLKERRRCS